MKIVYEDLESYRIKCIDNYNRIYNIINHLKYLLDSGYNIEINIQGTWFYIHRYYSRIDKIEVEPVNFFESKEREVNYKIFCIDERKEISKVLYYLSGLTNNSIQGFKVRIYPLEKFSKSFSVNTEDLIYQIEWSSIIDLEGLK